MEYFVGFMALVFVFAIMTPDPKRQKKEQDDYVKSRLHRP